MSPLEYPHPWSMRSTSPILGNKYPCSADPNTFIKRRIFLQFSHSCKMQTCCEARKLFLVLDTLCTCILKSVIFCYEASTKVKSADSISYSTINIQPVAVHIYLQSYGVTKRDKEMKFSFKSHLYIHPEVRTIAKIIHQESTHYQ